MLASKDLEPDRSMMPTRVLVAMSGGVDSSVAAALLTRDDYDVIGVTFNQWPASLMASSTGNGCCTPNTIDDARRVCSILDIPHYVVDYRKEFEAAVIDPWVTSYLSGETPNPCVMCNRTVRFGSFLTKATELGAEVIATGHYARIIHDIESGTRKLLTAIDETKDQSYVLHVLGQQQLKRTLFPLGSMKKMEVRKVAAELGLPVADKPESQEICFVPDNNHAAYVRKHGSTGSGQIVDMNGQHIGDHHGLEQYTPGQRRGLDLGGGTSPRYVISLDKNENRITVGSKTDAYAKSIELRNVHWVSSNPPTKSRAVEVRTRYRMPVEPAIISDVAGKTTVSFLNKAWAPAPGQAAVFYTGEEVLGGGTIDKVIHQ
mgnify:CR=1 FL=1